MRPMVTLPRLLAVATLVAGALTVAPDRATAAGPVTVQANNFRFCGADAAGCTPVDSGFQTTVAPGTQVTWVYRDSECDAIAPCPGHNVTFADAASKTIKQEG